MLAIQIGELPQEALLHHYKQAGAYTDCYFMDVPHHVTLTEYIETFYTTALFRVERAILASLAEKPSTDLQTKQLANGEITSFSAWNVEGRTESQLLLCDFTSRTRSWLMCIPCTGVTSNSTRLYFGSAVLPKNITAEGKKSFGFAFYALSGFHKLYTRALMRSTLLKLARSKSQ